MSQAYRRYRRITLRSPMNDCAAQRGLRAARNLRGVSSASAVAGEHAVLVQYDLRLVRMDEIERCLVARGLDLDPSVTNRFIRAAVHAIEFETQVRIQQPARCPSGTPHRRNLPEPEVPSRKIA